MEWAKANLQDEGWVQINAGDRAVLFVRAAPHGPRGEVRLWVRYEHFPSNIGVWVSTAALMEMDCAERRERSLQITGYTKNNLEGEAKTQADAEPPWQYATPGTLGETEIGIACYKPSAPAVPASAPRKAAH